MGFSVVEAVLAGAIFGLLVMAMVGAWLYGEESGALAGNRSRAIFLAEEGLEAVRNIRDNNFSNLVDGTYGISAGGNKWSLSGSSDTTGIFTRQVQISSNGSDRKNIVSTVTWPQNAVRNGSISLSSQLTYWQREVLLMNWTSSTIASSFNLTVANSGNETADGKSIYFANNKLYFTRVNSGGSEFYIFDVSDPSNPSILGRRDLNGTPNDVVVVGNYAYLASTDNKTELQIVNVGDPSTIQNAGNLTSVDLTVANSGNNTADSMALATDGSYLYMIRNGGDELLIFNIASNPSNPGNPVGRNPAITGVPADIVISGNFAYVATNDNSAELRVFNITNKSAPVLAATVNMNSGNNSADAKSLAIGSNYLYVGRQSSAAPEFYVYDVSNPLSPTLRGTVELGANVNGLSYNSSDNIVFSATGNTALDLRIVDVSNPLLPSVRTSLNTANSPVYVFYAPTPVDRVFLANTLNSIELQVVAPQ